jgi:hypothetical protein
MMHTIPHLVKMNNFPFEETVLAIDTAPLSGEKRLRPNIGSLEDVYRGTKQLLDAGIVDRVVEMNYDPDFRDRVYRKHFGQNLPFTHNFSGYPILGSIFAIENCKSDYMLHYDSDIMLHQRPGYSWVAEGIQLMKDYPDLMSVRPLAGPPSADGYIDDLCPHEFDPGGLFYRYKFFSSRVYLINRQRFDELIPFPIIFRPYSTQLLNRLPINLQVLYSRLTSKGQLNSWEVMVSKRLEKIPFFRCIMANPNAWTIHPKDRNSQFIQALPNIISKIEDGYYPPEQAGKYEFILELWQDIMQSTENKKHELIGYESIEDREVFEVKI